MEFLNLLKKNQWVVAASIFFILWKFFLVGILWSDRSIAPEPDDSYEYIARIASVSECQNGIFCEYTGVSMRDHSGFAYLSYGLIFGIVGKIFGLAPEKTFHLSFYLGTALLAIILPIFLSSLTQRRSLISLSIIFLAFYHGTGESHGFFWVVPSFYLTALFIVLFHFITSSHSKVANYIIAALVSITYVFMHPMSIYIAFLFPLYLCTHFYLTKTYSTIEIKKVAFILLIVFGSAGAQSIYLAHVSQLNYYGFSNSIFQARLAIDNLSHDGSDRSLFSYNIAPTKEGSFFASRIDALQATYFRYIFPHWIAILPFSIALWILYFRRVFRLLALYLSAFFFFITATLLNEFGFRSAIILWPITYLVAAFTLYHTYSWFQERSVPMLQYLGKSLVFLFTICFFALNGIFSISYNLNVSDRNNFQIDENFFNSLLSRMNSNDSIGLNGILARTPTGSDLFLSGKVTSLPNQPRFIARLDSSPDQQTNNKLPHFRAISLKIGHELGIVSRENKTLERDMLPPIEGYHLDSRFGDVVVFERN